MQRARRRWKLLSVAVAAPATAIVVALGLTASAPDRDPVTHHHLFPADYHGPVWIRFPETDAALHVRLEWGEWTYQWDVTPDDARSYRFSKDKPRPGDENVPLDLVVSPEVTVEFGHGTFPAGTEPLPAEWEPR